MSLKSKSTATHDGTLTQYAWHDSTVRYAFWRTPKIEFVSVSCVNDGGHSATNCITVASGVVT